MIGAADDLPLDFQRALLGDALPELQTLQGELTRAVELGREVERALERARESEAGGGPSAAGGQ